MAAPDLGLVFLVWGPMGTAPIERFLASWREREAGVDHEFVAVLNGFGDEAAQRETRELLAGAAARVVAVDAPLIDLGAYVFAAQRLDHRRLCFVNTSTEPLVDGWLAALASHLGDGVGAVGATGSYETARRGALQSGPWLRRAAAYAKAFPHHPAFPNPHLRTNAFAVWREEFLALDPGPMRTKEEAHRFESGRRSITRQLQARGGRVLVAGRDGVAYEAPDWPRSATFRSGGQRNLLVADNRTRDYEAADDSERARLERLSWG